MTGKSYSNGDAAVSYFYDQTSYNGLAVTNGVGRQTGMADASGAGKMALAYVTVLFPEDEELAALLEDSQLVDGEIVREGGFEQAAKDFDSLKGEEQTIPSDKGAIKVKVRPNGEKAVVRSFSREGRPTLEIQHSDGTYTKIRYQ